MNGNSRFMELSSHYQNYNDILQDSVFYEEEDDIMRGNFFNDDIGDGYDREEGMMEDEELAEDSTSQAPDSDLKSKRSSIEEFFRCTICYDKANKPAMCPHCSKICCTMCFKQWLNEHTSTCPCCRVKIDEKNLVKVRFMSELNEVNRYQIRLLTLSSVILGPQKTSKGQGYARSMN